MVSREQDLPGYVDVTIKCKDLWSRLRQLQKETSEVRRQWLQQRAKMDFVDEPDVDEDDWKLNSILSLSRSQGVNEFVMIPVAGSDLARALRNNTKSYEIDYTPLHWFRKFCLFRICSSLIIVLWFRKLIFSFFYNFASPKRLDNTNQSFIPRVLFNHFGSFFVMTPVTTLIDISYLLPHII